MWTTTALINKFTQSCGARSNMKQQKRNDWRTFCDPVYIHFGRSAKIWEMDLGSWETTKQNQGIPVVRDRCNTQTTVIPATQAQVNEWHSCSMHCQVTEWPDQLSKKQTRWWRTQGSTVDWNCLTCELRYSYCVGWLDELLAGSLQLLCALQNSTSTLCSLITNPLRDAGVWDWFFLRWVFWFLMVGRFVTASTFTFWCVGKTKSYNSNSLFKPNCDCIRWISSNSIDCCRDIRAEKFTVRAAKRAK